MPLMTLREQLLCIADHFAAASGIGRKRVSTIVLNGGGKLDAIARGRDLTTGSWERAMGWFSLNWPAGTAWPDHIRRPTDSAATPPPMAGGQAGSRAPLREPAAPEGC